MLDIQQNVDAIMHSLKDIFHDLISFSAVKINGLSYIGIVTTRGNDI